MAIGDFSLSKEANDVDHSVEVFIEDDVITFTTKHNDNEVELYIKDLHRFSEILKKYGK